jgi:dolichol-phosphate mannosyltransferase
MRHRFTKSFLFNNVEALIRIQLLWLVVESTHISSVLATAILLVIAFVVRFVFHALVVYAPKRKRAVATAEAPGSVADELAT